MLIRPLPPCVRKKEIFAVSNTQCSALTWARKCVLRRAPGFGVALKEKHQLPSLGEMVVQEAQELHGLQLGGQQVEQRGIKPAFGFHDPATSEENKLSRQGLFRRLLGKGPFEAGSGEAGPGNTVSQNSQQLGRGLFPQGTEKIAGAQAKGHPRNTASKKQSTPPRVGR